MDKDRIAGSAKDWACRLRLGITRDVADGAFGLAGPILGRSCDTILVHVVVSLSPTECLRS